MVASIREGLDEYGYDHIPIMSYATSTPRRSTGRSGTPRRGHRSSATGAPHQMDPGNVREALKEAALDIKEAPTS